MEIKSTIKTDTGEFPTIYHEEDPTKNLEGKILKGVRAFCFCNGKLLLVYAPEVGKWMPPGGGIEPGETFEQAVVREVKEETNMKVIHHELIGCLDCYEPNKTLRQTRSFCIVEPYGDFVSDPDGDIAEIRLIDHTEYKKYFDWGIVGDHIMKRAIEMCARYNQ